MTKVFFLDIDDCLIETSRLGIAELTALSGSLKSQNVKKASEITAEFERSFHRVYDSHQGKKLKKGEMEKLDNYMYRLRQLQTNIIREFGQAKKWSRECFLYISAEIFGVSLSSSQIETATVKLWDAITAHNPFYPDSLRFLKKLIAEKTKFYLISASDCRLNFDDAKNEFSYNPQYSRNLKLRRLEKFTKLGVSNSNIFTGDPYDKPNTWVFREALAKAEKDLRGGFEAVMAGDSLKNDLVPASEIGIKKLFLVNRHGGKVDNDSGIEINEIASFDSLIF